MIEFEEVVIAQSLPATFRAAPDQWTALLVRDRFHAPEVSATLMGERAPEEGRVTVGGADLYGMAPQGNGRLLAGVGVVSKKGRLLSNLLVGENIALPCQYRTLAGNKEARRMMRRLLDDLGAVGESLKGKLDGHVTALDQREREVTELLRAVLGRPDYFLFLNVTDDLSMEESADYIEFLKRERRPWQGGLFVVAKEMPPILDSMDTIFTLR